MSLSGIWQQLETSIAPDASPPADDWIGYWQKIAVTADPATYCPCQVKDIISVRLDDVDTPYYVLKQPQTQRYMRLSEDDFVLWQQMTGEKSVKDILFFAFTTLGKLPIGRMDALIHNLRNGGFLTDSATHLYDQLEQEVKRRNPASRGKRIVNAFLHTEISRLGLDPLFSTLYKWLKILFATATQLLGAGIIVVGGTLFSLLLWSNPFAGRQGGFFTTFLGLLLANTLVIFIHEIAHALTTKHIGRQLDRGGFLFYWGMPAFFVDTRDIWLSPRWRRIAVTWAGPHSGLFIGGLVGIFFALIQRQSPDFMASNWAIFIYQIGFLAYFSVVLNLNPLLELDGYFILMDYLDMPGLRERAFHFLRHKLPARFKEKRNPRTLWQEMSHHERIFSIFGVLAFLYSAYALFFSLYYWQTRIFPFLGELWTDYGLLGRIALVIISIVIVLPLSYFLALWVWQYMHRALDWLSRHGFLKRPDILILLVGIPLFLISLPIFVSNQFLQSWAVILLHIAAFIALAGVIRQMPGSRFQWIVLGLMTVDLGLMMSRLGEGDEWRQGALIVSVAGALLAGFLSYLLVRPPQLNFSDRWVMFLLLVLGIINAFGLNQSLTANQTDLRAGIFWMVAGITLTAILLTPLLVNFYGTRFHFPWRLLLAAMLFIPWLQLYPFLDLLIALLWCLGCILYLVLSTLAQFEQQSVMLSSTNVALSERERLADGFNHFLHAFFAIYEPVFGGRRLRIIESQIASLTPPPTEGTIFDFANYYKQAIALAVDRFDDLAGTTFTAEAAQVSLDGLPWVETETLSRYVLSRMDWGQQFAKSLTYKQDKRRELIRQANIFAGMDQEGINEILTILSERRVRSGVTLAVEGEDATQFMLIQSGEIAVYLQGEAMATLTAGGYFGTYALLDTGDYLATYRATQPTELLIINRADFDPLLRADTTLASQVTSGAATRHLLEQMPLFASLSPQQLATLETQLEEVELDAGTIIVTQNQARSHFFIILEGEVESIHMDEDGTETTLETMNAGQHFGEYALFIDTPYQATYRTTKPTTLLLLAESHFDKLVTNYSHMSNYVEQIGSGRLIATRRRLGLTGIMPA